jgi:hypothetical protein
MGHQRIVDPTSEDGIRAFPLEDQRRGEPRRQSCSGASQQTLERLPEEQSLTHAEQLARYAKRQGAGCLLT